MSAGRRKTASFISSAAGGGGGTGAVNWTTVTLTAANLLQDPQSILALVSYGPLQFITNTGNPGGIGGGAGNVDCPLWSWTIANPVSFTENTQLLMQGKFTGGPNTGIFVYIGCFDGTADVNRGVYGSINMTNGNTGVGNMGANPSNGTAAAAFSASGGNFSFATNFDGSLSRPRDALMRSTSNTGPAYGEQGNSSMNPGNFAGTNLQGFFGVGTNGGASATGGTFTGIELQYAVVPAYV